jgi:predicted nucleotidyltransferase
MVPSLIALYTVERDQAAQLLREIRKAAKAVRPAPLGVWLYGSVARGEDHPSSDIDVALVSMARQPSRQEERLRDEIASTIPARAGRISVVALEGQDLRKMATAPSAFWRRLERDAVVLAGDSPAAVRERFQRTGKRAE